MGRRKGKEWVDGEDYNQQEERKRMDRRKEREWVEGKEENGQKEWNIRYKCVEETRKQKGQRKVFYKNSSESK